LTVDFKSGPIEFVVEADPSVMKTGLYSNNFSKAFSKLLEKSGVSRYSIAVFTGLDEGYLSKLCSGERNNPSPETVMKIYLALARFSGKLTLSDFEVLFSSVGRSILIKRFSSD
jgi:transcriptional regulator with XRE-family HTH domain